MRRNSNSKPGHNLFAWIFAGIRLVVDLLKVLFKFRKSEDETWSEFLMVKFGSLLIIVLVSALTAVTLFSLYIRVTY